MDVKLTIILFKSSTVSCVGLFSNSSFSEFNFFILDCKELTVSCVGLFSNSAFSASTFAFSAFNFAFFVFFFVFYLKLKGATHASYA